MSVSRCACGLEGISFQAFGRIHLSARAGGTKSPRGLSRTFYVFSFWNWEGVDYFAPNSLFLPLQRPSKSMSDPIQIGDFRIDRQIGAGGMGIVYLATQIPEGRKVALKVLAHSLTRLGDVERFQREAQTAEKLHHPGIARFYSAGHDSREWFIAMEYIEGMSLRDCIERLVRTTKPDSAIDDFVSLARDEPAVQRFEELPLTEEMLPSSDRRPDAGARAGVNPYRSPQAEASISTANYIRRCTEIVRDAADALQYAHEHGVVHRDVKPDNLMLDRNGQVHIIDFGVARFFDDTTLTRSGSLVGTPIYMSPEQVTGRVALDARTDIYSLGMVLYELLVLQKPIVAESRDAVLRDIVTKPLRPISHLNRQVPGLVQKVVHKATAKDPDERYSSAREFAEDLQRSIAGEPVLATRYRYRIDESEIKAERPTSVTCIAILWFSLTGFVTMAFASGFAARNLVQMWVTFALLAISIFGGWSFITGRLFGRIVVSFGFSAIGLFYVGLGGLMLLIDWSGLGIFGIGAVFLLLGLSTVLDKRSRSWFALARRIRSENKASLRARPS